MKAAKLAMICFIVGCIFSAQGHQHHHHSHQDLEVEYSFNCEKPVSKVTVTLFAWAEAISVIEAQWITEQAQGIAELTATKPYIEWPL